MQQVQTLEQFEQDSDWINAHYEELKRRYSEEYVAVYRGSVVAHHREMGTLMKELTQKYGERATCLAVEFISSKKDELIL